MKRLLLLITICISSISFGQVPSYVPTNGLLAWYPFDGNANDESVNGYNGIVNGATLSTDRNGIPNSAYSFDGINDYILMTGYPTSYTSYTIAVWAEANAINQVTNGIAVQTGIKSGTKYGSYGIRARDQGDRFIGVHRNSASTLQGIDPLIPQDMNVHHYTQTWDGTTVQLYLDGVLVKTVNIASIGIVSSEFCVGAMYETSINHFFNGIIDDVGFWNRALTHCEISDLYNSQLGSLNTTGSETITECDAYTWNADGQTYTQSGQYTTVLTNAAGCDSTVTLDLTINNADNGINQLDDITLEATASNAQYQWVDCSENYQAISGATDQTFEATVNGDYACIVTENGCSDTTACITISKVGISDLRNDGISVYPNPASSTLTIESQAALNTSYRLIDAQGKVVLQGKLQGTITVINIENLAQGSYTLLFNQTELKIIKE